MTDWKHPWQSKTLILNLIMGALPFVYPKAYQFLSTLPSAAQIQILSAALCGMNFILRHLTTKPIAYVGTAA